MTVMVVGNALDGNTRLQLFVELIVQVIVQEQIPAGIR